MRPRGMQLRCDVPFGTPTLPRRAAAGKARLRSTRSRAGASSRSSSPRWRLPGKRHADKVPGVVLSPADRGERAAGRGAHRGGDRVQRSRPHPAARPRAGKGAASSWSAFPACRARSSWTPSASSATGGRVLRVEATPVERERLSIAQAGKLLDALDAVDDRHGRDGRPARAATTGRSASCARSARRRRCPRTSARGARTWSSTSRRGGRRSTSSASARTRRARRLLKLEGERRELVKERDRLLADVQALNRGGFSDRVVGRRRDRRAGARPGAELELEYFVPGARWKPAYDLHFASARGQMRVETAAVVEQATGEDWTDATLLLSTAMPGRGIDLPELLTWTLGERSEFVPQLRPRRPPHVEPPLPAPAVPRRRGRARDRRASCAQAAGAGVSSAASTTGRGGDGRRRPGRERYDCLRGAGTHLPGATQATRHRPRHAPPPGMAGGRAGRWRTPRPPRAVATSHRRSAERGLRRRPMPGGRARLAAAPAIRAVGIGREPTHAPRVPLALYDARRRARGPALSDPYLPGGQRRRPRLRLSGADAGDDRQLGQAGPHPARVADVPGDRVPRGDAGAGARPRSCARACATTASGRCCAGRRRSSATASWSAWARSRPPGRAATSSSRWAPTRT